MFDTAVGWNHGIIRQKNVESYHTKGVHVIYECVSRLFMRIFGKKDKQNGMQQVTGCSRYLLGAACALGVSDKHQCRVG